jgi:hypothetical protein
MSVFDLEKSAERARKRLGDAPTMGRRPRSDRGASRLEPEVLALVDELLSGQERPPTRRLLADIERACRERGLTPPSRATVYKLMGQRSGPTYLKRDLPEPVQEALYNLVPESEVPGHQLAFYCFNYGDSRAVSFAAGLPWLAIFQALRMRGYRARSRGLVVAVARARGIR